LHEEFKCNFSAEDLNNEYRPPQIGADKTIIIPQDYLKIKHKMQPRPKGKEHVGQAIRGHHLWKG